MNAELVSYAAATLTTAAFVPQAIKVLKQRDTRSLSLGMYMIFTVGVVLWCVYGWQRGDWAIVIANAITASLCIAILAAKVWNDTLARAAEKS